MTAAHPDGGKPQAGEAPLRGYRVLAVEQFGAGPFGSLFLADLGADVVRIEDASTGGDVARYVPPGQLDGDSLYFETFNRGKRSLCLDLHNDAGREVFHRLVASSHAVYNNLRGDLPAKLGLTYEQLAQHNRAVVCVSLSAYGRTGSDASRPGYDALIQAEAGWAALTGDPSWPPVRSGLPLVDYSAGLVAAVGLLAALLRAQRTGVGGDVDTSLLDTALAMLGYGATWYLSAGIEAVRSPHSAHPSVVPFQFFATTDGYVAVACAKEKFFRALMEELGLPVESQFADVEARRMHKDELVQLLASHFSKAPTTEWLERLSGRVPIAPVRTPAAALDQAGRERPEMVASYPHPTLGSVRTVGSPLHFSNWCPDYRPGPHLDEHRADVLSEVGYGASSVAGLEAAGAFGRRSHLLRGKIAVTGDDAPPSLVP